MYLLGDISVLIEESIRNDDKKGQKYIKVVRG